MNNFSLRKRIAYALAPLAVLLLIAMVPVSHAAEVIPDPSQVALADTTPPTDVENVKAAPADGSIKLSWDVATDNIGVKGYKVYYGIKSVVSDGGSYQTGPVDAGSKISFTVDKLTNGTKYYFAVTAYDAAGNESNNYSLEANATPLHGAADTQAPKVTKAEALDNTHVKVTFNEAVQLPTKSPENSFSIKNDTTSIQLQISGAVMNAADPTGKSVLLQTSKQQAGAPYVLTAGISVKDVAGNPIVSGTSDTAAFNGTDIVPSSQNPSAGSQQVTASAPEFTALEAVDNTHVKVTFNKPVVLKSNKAENFIITEQDNVENTVDVLSVDQSSDGTSAVLTTGPMKALKYNFIAVDVVDAKGVTMSVDNNATEFMGTTASTTGNQPVPGSQQVTDTTPPEDVTNFTASMVKKLIVTLKWIGSLTNSNDLAKYVLYMSTDGQNYGTGIDVSPTASTFDVTNIVPGVKYFFKLVAMDNSGNASPGVTTTFVLPQTGPGLGILLLGSIGAGKLLKRRKNKK